MRINGIDHINIITDQLSQTIGFYSEILGFQHDETPVASKGFKGAWMFDAQGNAIVHIIWKNPDNPFGSEHQPGQATAAFHHVAFHCEGYDEMIQRLKDSEITYRANGANQSGVRQIFLQDPNNIRVELNFSGN